jgi:hypothetical protein
MNCPKFIVLRESKKLGEFYSNEAGAVSRFEKLRICQALKVILKEIVAFRSTTGGLDSESLPRTPTFKIFSRTRAPGNFGCFEQIVSSPEPPGEVGSHLRQENRFRRRALAAPSLSVTAQVVWFQPAIRLAIAVW